MREKVTTLAEIVGAGFIASGVGVIFGLGACLIVAGLLIIAGSYMAGE
jgi:hypothetical protein